MRQEEKQKKVKRLLFIFGGVLVVAGLIFISYQLFKTSILNNIDINVQNLTCTDKETVREFIRSQNTNYFLFKSEDLESKLKKQFFCIGRVETKAAYPNRLKADVFGREPAFVVVSVGSSVNPNPEIELPDIVTIATESSQQAQINPVRVLNDVLKDLHQATGSATFLVDEEGVIYEQTDNLNFQKLSIFGADLKIGGSLETGLIRKVKDVINRLSALEAPTDNLIVIGDKLIIDSKPRIIFALNHDLLRQTASLQLILAQAKMNSDPERPGITNMESIDLRFDKPVVVYSGKK